MAIPANLDTVTVTGSYISADGTALTGTVTFTPTLWLRDGTGDVVIPQAPVVATLDETGAFSEVLVATDDTDVDQNWAYLVTETINGISESKTILLPASLVTVDMSELEPVVDTAVYEDMRGPRGYSVLNGSGAPTSAVGEDGDFYIDTASQAIYGPKSGASWGSATSLVAALSSSTPQPLGSAAAGTSTSAARADHVHSSTVANPTFSGVAAFPDGSASAPSVTNDGDTNTGVFFPAADTVAVATGGTERLRVNSSGNVGIGASPAVSLHVERDGAAIVQNVRNSTDVNPSHLYLLKRRGTNAAKTTVNSGDELGRITAFGYDGTNDTISAQFAFFADAAVSTGVVPGQFRLSAATQGGVNTERFRLDSNGLITGTGTSLGAWTAYTPTLSDTGWAVGDGTLTGAYCQIGKVVIFRALFTAGATSTFGASADPVISLPVTALSGTGGAYTFSAQLFDASLTQRYLAYPFFASTSTVQISHQGTSGLRTVTTATAPFTWTTSDLIILSGIYQAA